MRGGRSAGVVHPHSPAARRSQRHQRGFICPRARAGSTAEPRLAGPQAPRGPSNSVAFFFFSLTNGELYYKESRDWNTVCF